MIWDDIVLTAAYIRIEDMKPAENLYFDSYEVWTSYFDSEYGNRYRTRYTVTPDDAQEQKVSWSSSDPAGYRRTDRSR